MKNNKLLKASSFYFIGNIFDKAVAFITVPIFTRLLSASDYGITTTYLSWISILSVIITLSLGNSIRTAAYDYARDIDSYISSIFSLGTVSAVIITLVLSIGSIITNTSVPVKFIVLCCIQAYASSILSTIQWRYMMEVNYIKRTLIQCLPNLLIILLSIVLIKEMENDKFLGRIYSYVVVYVLFALIYLVYYLFKGHTIFNKNYWKYALNFSLPVIFHSLSVVILSQSDRTMITWLKDASETGIYGLAYQFGMIPLVFTSTLENVWIPWFAEKMRNNDKKSINQMVKPYINFIMILCVSIMLVAPEVLKLMTTREYYSAIYMIAPVILAIFLMFLASVSLDLEYYLQRTKTIAFNTLIAALVNIALNLIYIPSFGGTAAAYTTVVAYGISFFMHYVVAKKLDKELFPMKVYIIPITGMVIFTLLTILLMNYPIVRWGISGVLGCLCVIMGHKYIKIKRNKGNRL